MLYEHQKQKMCLADILQQKLQEASHRIREFEKENKTLKAELESFKKKELSRAKALVAKKAISERLYDESYSSYNIALADLKAAEAQLLQAQINLAYTEIKSPVEGRVSRAEVTRGNLVESGPGTAGHRRGWQESTTCSSLAREIWQNPVLPAATRVFGHVADNLV